MTYSSAVAYLYRLQKHGIKLGLMTITALNFVEGNFQHGIRFDGKITAMLTDGLLMKMLCQLSNFHISQSGVCFSNRF